MYSLRMSEKLVAFLGAADTDCGDRVPSFGISGSLYSVLLSRDWVCSLGHGEIWKETSDLSFLSLEYGVVLTALFLASSTPSVSRLSSAYPAGASFGICSSPTATQAVFRRFPFVAPAMTLSALDERLLGEDCTAAITLETLATLSPPQLAVAAARDDLGVLIRQRACHMFLSRRAAFLKGKEAACTETGACRLL